jgi:DNA-binding response OmpR family regulator
MYRLLVVENEAPLRELYAEELTEQGYEVSVVANGKDALGEIESGAIHLVILDVKMPGMNGLEVLEKMLHERRRIPVIINSGYSHYKNNFMSWAADAYVVKSSNLEELKDAVRKVLTRYYGEEK